MTRSPLHFPSSHPTPPHPTPPRQPYLLGLVPQPIEDVKVHSLAVMTILRQTFCRRISVAAAVPTSLASHLPSEPGPFLPPLPTRSFASSLLSSNFYGCPPRRRRMGRTASRMTLEEEDEEVHHQSVYISPPAHESP